MTIFHSVHAETGAIDIAYSGDVTPGTVLNFFDRFEKCLRRHPGFCEIVDLTAVERVSISSCDLACLFSLIHCIYLRSAPEKTIAFVATDHSVKFHAQSFVEYLADRQSGLETRLCENRHEAVTALRIPVEKRHMFLRH